MLGQGQGQTEAVHVLRRWRALLTCIVGMTAICPCSSFGRTFTPATFSSPYTTRVIPKFTEKVAQDSLSGGVFSGMGPSVTYTLEDCGKYVRFTVDPYRSRIVFSRNDVRSGAFCGRGTGNGAFINPQDIDIYVDKTLAIADAGNNRIVFMDWADNMTVVTGAEPHCQISYPDQGAIIPLFLWNVGPAEGFNFLKPSGVSVDDRGTPQVVSDDVLWVADTGNNRICLVWVDTYYGTVQSLGSYGSLGSGVGQFNVPLRAVRGRAAVNGDSTSSRNNSDLFVLDRGNRRIVKLHCDSLGTAANITWIGTVEVPNNPLLESIATDAWGNVYVTDSRNHHVLKYSPNLEWLASYGQFGTGVMNGDMRKPSDFRPQFRLDYGVTPPRPVATPFAILTESWSDSTGGQGCMLGLETQMVSTSTTGDTQRLDFRLTDHAFTRIEVLDGAGLLVRVLDPGTTFHNSGANSVVWDGRRDDGSLAQQCRTYRFRITPRTGYSATFDSTEIKTIDFDFGPRTPFTLTVQTDTSPFH